MSSLARNGAARCRRLLLMGLDCLAPALAFDRYLDDMPNLGQLMREGTWGELRSCEPPITVPAWMAMATSRDPGALGVYGFRHRRGHHYTEAWTANSLSLSLPPVWETLQEQGKRVCLVGFPPSYPPRPVDGWRVGCFLTPGLDRPFTHPPELAEEVRSVVPDYRFDVVFRTGDRARLRDQLHAMTRGHFDLIDHLLATKPWDLFWFVEIGTDRVHHAFWKFCDPEHPLYEPGNEFEDVIRDYYREVDGRLGRLLERLDGDTAVMLVSDHGAKSMRGAFAINQWLAQEGYLALEEGSPAPGTSLERCAVDWSRTTAWAWGGYYARLFVNVEGREAQGFVPASRYESTLSELTEAIVSIRDHEGRALANRVYRPEELYTECRGDAPDAMVYLDDLSWRAAGTLGWDSLHRFENDTGPDDAVHAANGCFVLRAPGVPAGERADVSIYDVAPTILDLFGAPAVPEMLGESRA
jgi:predicted AlkP superfamily phosphohydrolase/phosphomutase